VAFGATCSLGRRGFRLLRTYRLVSFESHMDDFEVPPPRFEDADRAPLLPFLITFDPFSPLVPKAGRFFLVLVRSLPKRRRNFVPSRGLLKKQKCFYFLFGIPQGLSFLF